MSAFLALVFVQLAAAGSAPCDKARQKADRKTGVTTVLFNGPDWRIIHSGDHTAYELSLFVHGEVVRTLQSGWSLDAKLTDGQAVRLALDEPAAPRAKTDETGSFTRWETAFSVPNEVVQALAAAPVERMRMDLGGGPETTEVGRSRGKKVQTAFACIASLIE